MHLEHLASARSHNFGCRDIQYSRRTPIALRRSHQGLPQEAPLKSLGIGDLFGVHVFLDLSFSDRLSAGRKEYAKHSMSIFKVLEERVLSISCVYHTNSEL